jgi:hypothetical protein
VELALHTYENIRYARVTRAHGTGVSTREQWHKADWDEIRANPQSLHLKREPWLLDFDAEAHAYEVYDDVVTGLRSDVKGRCSGTRRRRTTRVVGRAPRGAVYSMKPASEHDYNAKLNGHEPLSWIESISAYRFDGRSSVWHNLAEEVSNVWLSKNVNPPNSCSNSLFRKAY